MKKMTLVIFTLSILMSISNVTAADQKSDKYLSAVKKFADTVLEKGRDNYGEKKTPLFVDGLHVETLEPPIWKWSKGREWILCNFANQQALMRLLDGLTEVTGDAKYRQSAEDATRYILENSLAPNGLPFWGGHTAWDLKSDAACGTRIDKCKPGKKTRLVHELKINQPYFEMFWRVDPEKSAKICSQFWGSHITNWSTLDFNRHGSLSRNWTPNWEQKFDSKGEVPFMTEGHHLSFAGVIPPFVRTATMLAVNNNDKGALKWGRNMIEQWQRAKNPKTGLSGGQLSWRKGQDRAQDALQHVYPNINETILLASYHVNGRYRELTLGQMQAGELLVKSGGENAEVGQEFIRWAADDLKILGEKCYDKEAGNFPAMLTDGTKIDISKVKPGYYIADNFLPNYPNGRLLWSYALAYRLTKDPGLWPMIRELGKQFKLGDFGTADGKGRQLAEQTNTLDRELVHALIELNQATGDKKFLDLGCLVADNLLKTQTESGLFPRPLYKYPKGTLNHAFSPGQELPARKYARTGDEIPLTLLHLAAALEGKTNKMPQAVVDSQYFHCPFKAPLEAYQKKRKDNRTYDWLVFYGPRDMGATTTEDIQ